MTTDNRARPLGINTPARTNSNRDEDDTIKANERRVEKPFDKWRMNHGKIPPGTNLNTLFGHGLSGLWTVDSQNVARTITGIPTSLPRHVQFTLLVLSGAIGTQLLFPYGHFGFPYFARDRSNATTDPEAATWTEWRPWGPRVALDIKGDETAGAWAAHAALQARFMAAMNGPINTGGRAAVAFRFDHGLKNFRDKVLPITKAAGITVSQAYNPRNWHYTENRGVNASELNGWVAAGDVEIWNHSASHAGADTPEALADQIVNGLTEIEAELPAARGKVWGWNPPGVTTGNFGGFDGGKTPTGWGTFAGRLILRHHAIASGSLAGTQLFPLDGIPRDGLARFQIDSKTVAEVKHRIDEAIAGRNGLQIMLHPSVLDKEGYLTTTQFQQIVDYVVAKRTAGELLTLSPYQLTVADSRFPAPPPGA